MSAMQSIRSFGQRAASMTSGITGMSTSSASEAPLLVACREIIDAKEPQTVDMATMNQVVSAARSTNSDMQMQGLLALVILSEDQNNKITIITSGGLPTIIDCISSSNPQTQYAAARVLWHLSEREENRHTIIESGGIIAAQKSMGSDQQANQYAGVRIMLQLSESKMFHAAVLKSDVPYTLTKLLGSPSDQVSYVSASTISFLIETDSEHPAFSDDGFIGTLSNVASEGTENAKYAAFSVVRSAASNRTTIEKLAATGILESLINAMSSDSERLQYISMVTLIAMPTVVEDKVKSMVTPALENMRSDRPSVVGAAAKFIKKFIHIDALRDAIIKKNDYSPFLSALSSPDAQVQAAGALALNEILKNGDAAATYIEQGGVTGASNLLHGDATNQSAGVSLLWPLSWDPKHRPALTEQILSQEGLLQGVAGSHPDINSRLLACLTLAALKAKDSKSVKKFCEQNSYKDTEIAYQFSKSDGSAISGFFATTTSAGQQLAVWVFALLARTDGKMFLDLSGYDVLDEFACTGTPQAANMANEVLETIDLTAGIKPEDATALLEFFLGDVKTEIENVEKMKHKRDELEKDLKVRYRRRENIDKLKLFQPLGYVDGETNNQLNDVLLCRKDIDEQNTELIARLKEIDPLLPPLQREIDIFKELFAKEEDREKINALKQQIAEFAKQVADTSKKIESETKLRDEYDGQKRSLLANLNTKTQMEQEKFNLIAELEDVQYQIDHYDEVMAEMDKDKEGAQAKQDELQELLDSLKDKREELIKQIAATKEDITDWERKLVDYESLRRTIERFKEVRKEVKTKYGEELTELVEFHGLLGGLMNSGYNKLRALSGEETPREQTSAFTKENLDKYMDFGSKAEVELDERVSELYSDLEGGLLKAKMQLQDLDQQLKALNIKIEQIEGDLQRAKETVGICALRKGQMPTKEQLEVKKKELQRDVEQMGTKIAALADVEKEIASVNEKIEEQSKVIAKDGAHRRRIEANKTELERQLKLLYGTLEHDLGKFAESFSRFKKSRGAFQSKLRPLLADSAEWKRLFAQEKELTTAAWTSLNSIVSDIQMIVDGITNAKEDELFLIDKGEKGTRGEADTDIAIPQ